MCTWTVGWRCVVVGSLFQYSRAGRPPTSTPSPPSLSRAVQRRCGAAAARPAAGAVVRRHRPAVSDAAAQPGVAVSHRPRHRSTAQVVVAARRRPPCPASAESGQRQQLRVWTGRRYVLLRPVRHDMRYTIFSARCNLYISRLCCDVSVRLSVRLSVCL